VLREVNVRATTIERALRDQECAALDWIKIDAQGADLRIFESIPENFRDHMVAVDTEPGLLDGYIGEDLFVDVHRVLRSQGFWLSRVDVRGTQRVSKETIDFLHPLHTVANGTEIGERAAEPAIHHVGHAGTRGGFLYFLLGLLLGADEQDRTAIENDLVEKSAGDFDLGEGLVEVDNVNSVTRGKNEFFHLGVPPLGLMTEMNPGFQQLFNCYAGQCILRCFIPRPHDFWWRETSSQFTTGF